MDDAAGASAAHFDCGAAAVLPGTQRKAGYPSARASCSLRKELERNRLAIYHHQRGSRKKEAAAAAAAGISSILLAARCSFSFSFSVAALQFLPQKFQPSRRIYPSNEFESGARVVLLVGWLAGWLLGERNFIRVTFKSISHCKEERAKQSVVAYLATTAAAAAAAVCLSPARGSLHHHWLSVVVVVVATALARFKSPSQPAQLCA